MKILHRQVLPLQGLCRTPQKHGKCGVRHKNTVLPKMIVTRLAFRKAVYVALILSFVGLLLVCLPLFGLQQTGKFATGLVPQIAVGYAAMVLMVEVVGIPFRSALTRFWAGGLFAFALFIAGVLAGSTASMVVCKDFDPVNYILSPLFFLGVYGFFPALIIGFIGVSILRSNSRKTGEQASSSNGG